MTGDLSAELPCGAATDALLEQALERPGSRDEHQQGCVHCSAALAEYTDLFAPLRAAAAQVVVPPPDLLDTVLRRLRTVLGSPGWAVLPGPDGTTRVPTEVLVRVARSAADTVPGVRVCVAAAQPATAAPPPGNTPPVDAAAAGGFVGPSSVELAATGSTIAVEVTVAADFGVDLHALGLRVSDRVAEELVRVFGVRIAASTVHIDDVLPRAA